MLAPKEAKIRIGSDCKFKYCKLMRLASGQNWVAWPFTSIGYFTTALSPPNRCFFQKLVVVHGRIHLYELPLLRALDLKLKRYFVGQL
jgi:hypothetical protein